MDIIRKYSSRYTNYTCRTLSKSTRTVLDNDSEIDVGEIAISVCGNNWIPASIFDCNLKVFSSVFEDIGISSDVLNCDSELE
ncbi:unnamed protein product [Rhizophagus irregularis]|nr:unnamed protein product [Rhizophagus irregularis]